MKFNNLITLFSTFSILEFLLELSFDTLTKPAAGIAIFGYSKMKINCPLNNGHSPHNLYCGCNGMLLGCHNPIAG